MFNRLRNILRPAEQKSSRTSRLIAFESGGRARWTPRDYAALAREGELRRRRADDNWRRTGLEALSLDEVIEQFKERAAAYEDADGSDATEHLYDDLKHATDELQRRPGDQRRALFALYTDPDIRVRQAAASADAGAAIVATLIVRLTTLSVEQLTQRFIELVFEQKRAELYGEIAKLNRLLRQMWAVQDELKSRPGDEI